MKTKLILIFAIILVATSCSAPTPTPLPFSKLNLDGILVQASDLPVGCVSGQISYIRANDGYYEKYAVPQPDYYITQQIVCDGRNGSVQVFIYENEETATQLFETISSFITNLYKTSSKSNPEIAESAFVVESQYHETDLVFKRCHAVITIDTLKQSSMMVSYAQRLDFRLQPLVCDGRSSSN